MSPKALLLVALLLAPLPAVAAAAPDGMTVSGSVTANGKPAREGAPVVLSVPGVGSWSGAVGPDGKFSVLVPADDPATISVEGAREGDRLDARVLGEAFPLDAAFRAGGAKVVQWSFTLPDLAVVSAVADGPMGSDVNLTVTLVNRGHRAATLVRATVLDGERVLATAPVGDVPPNPTESRRVVVRVPVADLGSRGGVTVALGGAGGDADPASDRVFVPLAAGANAPPSVDALGLTPSTPVAGEPVTLAVEASDADGIASVRFFWDDGDLQTLSVTSPPWRAVLGPYEEGREVRYWAVVTDASAGARATTTTQSAFTVGPAASGTPGTGGTTKELPPDAAADPAPSSLTGPLLAAVAVVAAGASILVVSRRGS